MSQIGRYNVRTELVYGPGSLAKLPEEIGRLGGGRAIVVSDRGLAQAGLVDRVTDLIRGSSIACETYVDVPGGPTFDDVDRAVDRIREADVDTVISLGSGSVLAAGRSASVVATHDVPSSIALSGPVEKITRPPLLSICIPTTAGSGGEVSRQATLTDPTGKKTGIRGRDVAARLAILDAELLTSVPRRQAVDSGIDALTHALEAYVANRASLMTDSLALTAFETIFRSLPVAIEQRDTVVLDRLLLASSMANLACGNAGLGLVHGLNAGITYLFHTGRYPAVPYGALHAVLLPWVLQFNIPSAPAKYATLARLMGATGPGTDEQLAAQGVDRLKAWLSSLGGPRRLPWEGVPPEEDLALVAGDVLSRAMARDNPRASTAEDLVEIVRQSVAGW